MTNAPSITGDGQGRITAIHYGHRYQVQLDDQRLVQATISSQMWKHWVRLAVGDRVQLEISAAVPDRVRITWRLN